MAQKLPSAQFLSAQNTHISSGNEIHQLMRLLPTPRPSNPSKHTGLGSSEVPAGCKQASCISRMLGTLRCFADGENAISGIKPPVLAALHYDPVGDCPLSLANDYCQLAVFISVVSNRCASQVAPNRVLRQMLCTSGLIGISRGFPPLPEGLIELDILWKRQRVNGGRARFFVCVLSLKSRKQGGEVGGRNSGYIDTTKQ